MADFDPDSYLASFDPDTYLSGGDQRGSVLAQTGREVAKAVPRGLLEGADMARSLANPVATLEKGAYQPIAAITNAVRPGTLPSHLLPSVQDAAERAAPEAMQAIARDEHAPALPRYAGAVTEAVANPMSWVGPGGPLSKGAIAAFTGGYGQAAEDVAGEPGRIMAGLALPAAAGARGAIGAPRPAARPAAAPAEPLPSLATVRDRSGVRLLPADVPHVPEPRPSPQDSALADDAAGMRATLTGDAAARRAAGAAGTPGTGPLSEVSPVTLDKLKEVFAQEGFTPDTLDQRLEEMSNHEYLGEISPNTSLHMSAINGTGGGARNEITNSVRQRAREAGERMTATFDRAFGPTENRAQLRRSIEIDRDRQVRPFWDAFRDTPIAPTPAINALLPRLDAAGALQAADRALRIEGLPRRMGFERLGTGDYVQENPNVSSAGVPAQRAEVPTAAAFQAAKEHLDDLIEKALANPGGANEARRLTALKNDLVDAIDKHPDQAVAGIWKQARDQYATPTSVIKAMKTGESALTGNIHAEDLPFLTASYSPTELRAFNVGIRGRLEDIAGRPGKTERNLINTILAPSNQAKIRWAVGDARASDLIAAIEHEERMHNAPNALIYNSMTQPRQEAAKFWQPGGGMLADVTLGDIAHGIRHPVKTGISAGANKLLAKRAERQAGELARTREEAARILTLQGPERDMVARQIVDMLNPDGGSGAGADHRRRGGRIQSRRKTHFADGGATGARNAPYVRPIPATYSTDLGSMEPIFRAWVAQNKVPFDPDAKGSDYDMRGFWRGLVTGDPRAQSAVDPNDGRLHFPDDWKTPSHETFSNQSQWATPDAPQWNERDQLVAPSGRIVFDDRDRGGPPRFAAGGRVAAHNINHAPSEAQKHAGNYAKDHVSIHGLDITIENAKGASRAGVDRGGKPWSVKMPAHYGYIKGTVGRDKDHVDVYVGPHVKSPRVFIVDQVDADTKLFDEHKVFVGFASSTQARRTYVAAFSDGKGARRLGHMAEMSVSAFKDWLAHGDTTKAIEGATDAHKESHAEVGYVTRSAVSSERCALCAKFIPPRNDGPGCNGVMDPIKPTGWCRKFMRAGSSARPST